ncbi:MAG: SWIM zinc finger domain-containing protein, partial [Caldilineaceae bacterium]|nr:SWIM zinc finger domain-containing protein [Caldilineaceae bacterium]
MRPNLTESQIRAAATPQSFDRGQGYYQSGAVDRLSQRGKHLSAAVEGSSWEPYYVEIEFDEAGITSTACTCPYDFGGWCKHIVAVALACIDLAHEIDQLPSLDELLDGLDAERLANLV